ncbi:hypothetical protein EDB85DRAFT_2191058 [Lactarius pseudohatsudake]|nr:hypothetical protein EDB85DRAFT_2191058 [Lactarius pseudohatsudake]
MADEMKNMEERMANKDEEIVRLSGGEDLGLAQEREEELIRRVEEEEAKSAVQKAERRVAAEISKVKNLEEKNAGVNKDVRQVRDALKESHAHAQSLKTTLGDRDSLVHSLRVQERALKAQVGVLEEQIGSLRATQSTPASSATPSCTHDGSVTDVKTVEKLLAAVDRLRGERDDLRRQLEFLRIESKFTIEALENKINSGASSVKAAATTEDSRVLQLQKSSRLGLIASASLVMVEHLQTRVDHDGEAMDQALIEISHLRSRLQDTMASSEESHHTSHTLQQSLLDLQLQTGVERLQSQDHGKRPAFADVTNALEDAESERNSLRVEVVNLQGDMVSAQNSLKQAEQRYSDLQNQQLSSMSSFQVNRKLKEQIEELEGRVARRTEQIGIHQHDIKRLETNLKLQEDRISRDDERTRDRNVGKGEHARDRALRKADDLEDAAETLEAQRRSFEAQHDSEVSALVEVWSSTLVKSRSSIAHLRAAAHGASAANLDMSRRLQFISAERDSALSLLKGQASELELDQRAAATYREEARNAVVALAVVRTADAEHRRTIQQDRERLCALLSATRDELSDRLKEISSLQDQLQGRRVQDLAESTEQQAMHSAEVAKLNAANVDLSQSCAELEHELAQSRKELHLATEQHDRLRADTDAIKDNISQLQTDHTEELESLRGKLQQVAVDLQEAREAHALTEKASLELSAANAELEGRLDILSKQRDADSVLIADLQSREEDHSNQVLGIQSRLDNATEELQQTTREKDDLEILLRQAKTDLSRATDTTEDRVRELLEERDALQEKIDQAESQHATELVQVQERLRRFQTEADSLREQLDKAIADTKRMRTTFETELRESAERWEDARAQQDAAQAQLTSLEAEFDDMETRVRSAIEEKDALEAKNTNIESEIQRTLSMQRYLESQLKDSAHESTVAKAELEQVKEKFAHAERDGKAAEIRLTFQAAQHDQAMASLKQEIQNLQAASRQDDRVQELEGKIEYMDALMRSKTQEIEENDDRFIELHKEKKKLTAKVDTLSRKVQTLQIKIVTLRDSANNQDPAQHIASTSKQRPSLGQPFASTQHTKSSSPLPAVPSGSPSRSRTMSGPSTLVSRKTPEGRRAPSVFRAKTPEPAKTTPPGHQDALPTVAVAGKKRAAPDDGDEAVPVQGFTSEGVLVKEHNSATTPRRRKSPRTGFTPVRNTTARPLTTLVVPGPAAAEAPTPPVISDVTNSPRGQPPADAKVKRSWLGAPMSKPSQSSGGATARVISTRPGAAERGR